MLIENVSERFPNKGSLNHFCVMTPRSILTSPEPNYGDEDIMKALAKEIPRLSEEPLQAEWDTFKQRVRSPDLKVGVK